jgi:hypothetical protein
MYKRGDLDCKTNIFINMNLQENIQRIKTIMEIDESQKITSILFPLFDKVFNRFDVTKSEDSGYVTWYDKNLTDKNDDNISLHKNWWGRFYIEDCDTYNELMDYKTFLSLKEDNFNDILKKYLNNRYKEIFLDRPIQNIHYNYCGDDYTNL